MPSDHGDHHLVRSAGHGRQTGFGASWWSSTRSSPLEAGWSRTADDAAPASAPYGVTGRRGNSRSPAPTPGGHLTRGTDKWEPRSRSSPVVAAPPAATGGSEYLPQLLLTLSTWLLKWRPRRSRLAWRGRIPAASAPSTSPQPTRFNVRCSGSWKPAPVAIELHWRSVSHWPAIPRVCAKRWKQRSPRRGRREGAPPRQRRGTSYC